MTPELSMGLAVAAYAAVVPATRAIVAPVAITMVRRRGCLMVVHLVSWRGLDEYEWVAEGDRYDLGAVADQGGHALQRAAGQWAAGAATGTGTGTVWVRW